MRADGSGGSVLFEYDMVFKEKLELLNHLLENHSVAMSFSGVPINKLHEEISHIKRVKDARLAAKAKCEVDRRKRNREERIKLNENVIRK